MLLHWSLDFSVSAYFLSERSSQWARLKCLGRQYSFSGSPTIRTLFVKIKVESQHQRWFNSIHQSDPILLHIHATQNSVAKMSESRRRGHSDRKRSRSPNESSHSNHDDREFGQFFLLTMNIIMPHIGLSASKGKRCNYFENLSNRW